MTDALAVNDSPRRTHGRGFGTPSVSIGLQRSHVARDKPPAKAAKPKPANAVVPTVAKPSHPPVVGRVLESYEEIIQAFRDRADDLEISRNELDGLTGLADAHCSMLLMKSPMKTPMKVFGPKSLPAMLRVLGLRFRIEEDVEQTALTLRRRKRRVSTHAHYGHQFSPIGGTVTGWFFGHPAPIARKPKR